jgi:hypothetical protein
MRMTQPISHNADAVVSFRFESRGDTEEMVNLLDDLERERE